MGMNPVRSSRSTAGSLMGDKSDKQAKLLTG